MCVLLGICSNDIKEVRAAQSLVLCVVFCRLLFDLILLVIVFTASDLILLVIVFTASDYLFGIFKLDLFLQVIVFTASDYLFGIVKLDLFTASDLFLLFIVFTASDLFLLFIVFTASDLFLRVIVFTASDYLFGIFKLFLPILDNPYQTYLYTFISRQCMYINIMTHVDNRTYNGVCFLYSKMAIYYRNSRFVYEIVKNGRA